MRTRSLTRPARLALAAGVVVAILGHGLGPTAVGAQPAVPPDAPSAATVLGARWLARQLTPGGYVEGLYAPGPDADATRDVAFTLAATGLEREAFEAALGWITANVDQVIAPDGEPDGAGTLGVLIMLALAVGEDPRAFGGVDLIARLEASSGLHEPGLYGEADPTFDGVLRQSLALLALDAVGTTPAPGAIEWLVAQQCVDGASAPESVGGFPNYRDPSTPCTAPDAASYTGAETDATAVALQYLVVLDGADGDRPQAAKDFLRSVQSADGGFPWFDGDVNSPNSTALAIGGLVAVGEGDAATVAINWLVAQQLGCDSPDAGAFTSSYSEGAADQFATRQAVLGVAGVSLPLPTTDWNASPSEPCPDPAPAPTPEPAPSTTAAIDDVPATPRYTG